MLAFYCCVALLGGTLAAGWVLTAAVQQQYVEWAWGFLQSVVEWIVLDALDVDHPALCSTLDVGLRQP